MTPAILITAGALTAGYVALSRERAKMAGSANPDQQATGAIEPATGEAGLSAAAQSSGEAPIGDTPIAGGSNAQVLVQQASADVPALSTAGVEGNASTGGADPSTQASVPAVKVAEAPTESTPTVERVYNPSMVYFGTTKQLTRQQQATALYEIGPMAGMVW